MSWQAGCQALRALLNPPPSREAYIMRWSGMHSPSCWSVLMGEPGSEVPALEGPELLHMSSWRGGLPGILGNH